MVTRHLDKQVFDVVVSDPRPISTSFLNSSWDKLPRCIDRRKMAAPMIIAFL